LLGAAPGERVLTKFFTAPAAANVAVAAIHVFETAGKYRLSLVDV
jgi:hypothetical protein